MFSSHASRSFWECYKRLPVKVQRQPDRQFALFESDPFHRSLRLKAVGDVWVVRVSRSYRALARRKVTPSIGSGSAPMRTTIVCSI